MVRFWYTPPRKFFSGQPNQSIIGFIKKRIEYAFLWCGYNFNLHDGCMK